MKLLPYLLLFTLFSLYLGSARAEIILSEPLGFNKITCPVNSDTIVGVPFRKEGSIKSTTSSAPLDVTGQAEWKEIPLNGITLTDGALSQHYLKFNSGTRDGRWYDITGNTTTSVTIDLNGDDLTGVDTGDALVIAEYWTLDTLFPPNEATTDWSEDAERIPNGHAIVASTGDYSFQLETLLLMPNNTDDGINRSASRICYIAGGNWKSDGEILGTTPLYPDTFFTIRHLSPVDHPTEYRSSGEVLTNNFSIPIHSLTSGSHDTFVSLPRPVDVTLNELNLFQSGAFVPSAGDYSFQLRDLLMVYDNTQILQNKSADVIYYHNGTNWMIPGEMESRDDDKIPAGSGFFIRKFQTESGETAFWTNTPSY